MNGEPMIRRTVHYSGRVQGVGFRYRTCRLSAGFKVTGYVRNLPDGRVEAVIEGESSEVDSFCGAISQSLRANIEDQHVSDEQGDRQFASFDVQM